MNFCPNCGYNLVPGTPMGRCPIESDCSWKLVPSGTAGIKVYRCVHGAEINDGHPRGYCDQGCCK
jgi:hypothetical protein